jgi:hypothetical protein
MIRFKANLMTMHTIRVSDAEDRKLWRLILRNKWEGSCSDRYTYRFTADQLHVIKKAGIQFEELVRRPARERELRLASG